MCACARRQMKFLLLFPPSDYLFSLLQLKRHSLVQSIFHLFWQIFRIDSWIMTSRKQNQRRRPTPSLDFSLSFSDTEGEQMFSADSWSLTKNENAPVSVWQTFRQIKTCSTGRTGWIYMYITAPVLLHPVLELPTGSFKMFVQTLLVSCSQPWSWI